MTNQTEAEVSCALRLRQAAWELVSTYADADSYQAAILGVLAEALEQEAKAQFKDPSKLKFFTTENEE